MTVADDFAWTFDWRFALGFDRPFAIRLCARRAIRHAIRVCAAPDLPTSPHQIRGEQG